MSLEVGTRRATFSGVDSSRRLLQTSPVGGLDKPRLVIAAALDSDQASVRESTATCFETDDDTVTPMTTTMAPAGLVAPSQLDDPKNSAAHEEPVFAPQEALDGAGESGFGQDVTVEDPAQADNVAGAAQDAPGEALVGGIMAYDPNQIFKAPLDTTSIQDVRVETKGIWGIIRRSLFGRHSEPDHTGQESSSSTAQSTSDTQEDVPGDFVASVFNHARGRTWCGFALQILYGASAFMDAVNGFDQDTPEATEDFEFEKLDARDEDSKHGSSAASDGQTSTSDAITEISDECSVSVGVSPDFQHAVGAAETSSSDKKLAVDEATASTSVSDGSDDSGKREFVDAVMDKAPSVSHEELPMDEWISVLHKFRPAVEEVTADEIPMNGDVEEAEAAEAPVDHPLVGHRWYSYEKVDHSTCVVPSPENSDEWYLTQERKALSEAKLSVISLPDVVAGSTTLPAAILHQDRWVDSSADGAPVDGPVSAGSESVSTAETEVFRWGSIDDAVENSASATGPEDEPTKAVDAVAEQHGEGYDNDGDDDVYARDPPSTNLPVESPEHKAFDQLMEAMEIVIEQESSATQGIVAPPRSPKKVSISDDVDYSTSWVNSPMPIRVAPASASLLSISTLVISSAPVESQSAIKVEQQSSSPVFLSQTTPNPAFTRSPAIPPPSSIKRVLAAYGVKASLSLAMTPLAMMNSTAHLAAEVSRRITLRRTPVPVSETMVYKTRDFALSAASGTLSLASNLLSRSSVLRSAANVVIEAVPPVAVSFVSHALSVAPVRVETRESVASQRGKDAHPSLLDALKMFTTALLPPPAAPQLARVDALKEYYIVKPPKSTALAPVLVPVSRFCRTPPPKADSEEDEDDEEEDTHDPTIDGPLPLDTRTGTPSKQPFLALPPHLPPARFPSLSFSFYGGNGIGPNAIEELKYATGAAISIRDNFTPEATRGFRYLGSGLGAFVAAMMAFRDGKELEDIVTQLIGRLHEAGSGRDRFFGVVGVVSSIVYRLLNENLPYDVSGEWFEGRLGVSVTTFPGLKNIVVDHFRSRLDLIQVIMASCYLPLAHETTIVRDDTIIISGALTNPLPRIDDRTITISAIPADANISPWTPSCLDLASQGYAAPIEAPPVKIFSRSGSFRRNSVTNTAGLRSASQVELTLAEPTQSCAVDLGKSIADGCADARTWILGMRDAGVILRSAVREPEGMC